MFNLTGKDKRTKLEKEIEDLLAEMRLFKRSSPEYSTMAENVKILYEAKSCEKQRHVSPDTIAQGMFSIGGILLILNFEKIGSLTSKAVGFVIKGRV
jgi:hypothetical protein